MLIDFEYSGPNYCAFDLGDHFCEFAGRDGQCICLLKVVTCICLMKVVTCMFIEGRDMHAFDMRLKTSVCS